MQQNFKKISSIDVGSTGEKISMNNKTPKKIGKKSNDPFADLLGCFIPLEEIYPCRQNDNFRKACANNVESVRSSAVNL